MKTASEVVDFITEGEHSRQEEEDFVQSFADQQNKELREENERLIAGIRRGQHLAENLKWSDDPNAEGFTANEKEIQRLTSQNKELREKLEKMKLLEVISKTENEVSKEESNDIIVTMAKSRMEWRQAVRDRNTEIQRLTKEVEELKQQVTCPAFGDSKAK